MVRFGVVGISALVLAILLGMPATSSAKSVPAGIIAIGAVRACPRQWISENDKEHGLPRDACGQKGGCKKLAEKYGLPKSECR